MLMLVFFFFVMIRRPPRSTLSSSSAASDVYKRQGNATKFVNKDAISNIELCISSFKEQEKIGSFFKQIDDTIDLHQRKLDLLKEQKKGFLQKMFAKNGAKVPELRFAGFADDWEERKLGDICLLYTSDAADEEDSVDLGGRRII